MPSLSLLYTTSFLGGRYGCWCLIGNRALQNYCFYNGLLQNDLLTSSVYIMTCVFCLFTPRSI